MTLEFAHYTHTHTYLLYASSNIYGKNSPSYSRRAHTLVSSRLGQGHWLLCSERPLQVPQSEDGRTLGYQSLIPAVTSLQKEAEVLVGSC